MNRAECLREADALIHGQRSEDYGCPEENMRRIAILWGPIMGHAVTPAQVALCMAQLKVARLCKSPDHPDSWLDLAGYVAIGAECATRGIAPIHLTKEEP